jgi:hypothetical protein
MLRNLPLWTGLLTVYASQSESNEILGSRSCKGKATKKPFDIDSIQSLQILNVQTYLLAMQRATLY